MTTRSWAVLALLGSTLIWGLGPVVTKLGLFEIPPFSLAFFRNTLALLILLPFAFKGLKRVERSDVPRLLLIGLFGSGLNSIFFLSGLAKTSATSSAAIFATVPLINAIAASLILREKPTLIRILGVMVGFLGSILIALGPAFLGQEGISGDVLGNFLVMGAVFSWVIYIIGSKKLLEKYSPLTIITFSILSGVMLLLPLFFVELINDPLWYLDVSSTGLISIVYGGFFSGVLAFLLFQWGMLYTSAFEAGIVIYLQPPLTDIFAGPILTEKLSPVFLAGTVLILGGVFLATTYELIKKRREK